MHPGVAHPQTETQQGIVTGSMPLAVDASLPPATPSATAVAQASAAIIILLPPPPERNRLRIASNIEVYSSEETNFLAASGTPGTRYFQGY